MTMVTSPNTVCTRGIEEMIARDPEYIKLIHECLVRHTLGDWGELCDDDKAMNDAALDEAGYILSAYTVKDTKIWIITDAGWKVTTILLPREY